jgi:hypothetical protein
MARRLNHLFHDGLFPAATARYQAIAAMTRPPAPSILRPSPTPSGSTLSGGRLPPGNPLRPGTILTGIAAGAIDPIPTYTFSIPTLRGSFTI